ncbi:TPA: Rop family plasmid primer RNA-binding protein, partial [Klebsiella pneumoniae]|nr:Rop family plasmid primer RNA-binding protein [Klebsiella pneumoniae]
MSKQQKTALNMVKFI